MAKISIGPGGTSGLGYDKGLAYAKELGLTAMEVEFTYGVSMKNDEAKRIGDIAKKLGISLSIHAPYYINLASDEKPKIHASKNRILQSCERGIYLGAKYIVFHAGFYQKKDPEVVFQAIKKEILDLLTTIKKNKWNIQLAPEVTGKPSQFGSLAELLRLKKETGCHITVDFAHLKARNNGIIDYDKIMKKLKPLKHIHAHFSGIEWTPKGERRHLITENKYIKELIQYIIKYNLDVTIINESPDPFADSTKTKKIIDSLK